MYTVEIETKRSEQKSKAILTAYAKRITAAQNNNKGKKEGE